MGELKRKPVAGLDAKQLAALNDWANTYRTTMPKMAEIATAARKVNEEMIAAPVWRAVEGRPEEGQSRPPLDQQWSIGPPTVNYVDNIELPTGIADAKPDTKGPQQ
jgi:hypothetical protein